MQDTTEKNIAFGRRAKAMIERGEKPPQRAVKLIHGDLAEEVTANVARGVREERIKPIEVIARKPT